MEHQRQFVTWLKATSIVLTAVWIQGCATATAVVADAEDVEGISAIGMGCKSPYELTQDCSGFSGATRVVEVSGVTFKIAGSADGKIVLMMGAKPNSSAISGKNAEAANVAYEVTKKLLLDNGINIELAEPVRSLSTLFGYVITTDGDSFAVLSQHSPDQGRAAN